MPPKLAPKTENPESKKSNERGKELKKMSAHKKKIFPKIKEYI